MTCTCTCMYVTTHELYTQAGSAYFVTVEGEGMPSSGQDLESRSGVEADCNGGESLSAVPVPSEGKLN